MNDQPVKLELWIDECSSDMNPLDPEDGSGWKLISFCSSHINFEDPNNFWIQLEDEDEFIERINKWEEDRTNALKVGDLIAFSGVNRNKPRPQMGWTPELQAKLDNGTAFLLSYYEHGLGKWSRQGCGTQCQWDTAQMAGILICPDDWTPVDETSRERQIDKTLEVYSDWCNGNVYGFDIEDADGDTIDSCGGFIGSEYIVEHIKSEHPELFDENGDVKDEIEVDDPYGLL